MRFTYGTEKAVATNGQPYRTLVYTGIKDEGVEAPWGHKTEKEAWDAFFLRLNILLEDATVVEWRMPPRIDWDFHKGFRVVARFAIIETAGEADQPANPPEKAAA